MKYPFSEKKKKNKYIFFGKVVRPEFDMEINRVLNCRAVQQMVHWTNKTRTKMPSVSCRKSACADPEGVGAAGVLNLP